MRYKFLFTIFVFFVISALITLGCWQLIRLNWKIELIDQIETSLKDKPVNLSSSKLQNYLRIKTDGLIDSDNQIYLYNLNEKGEPGFEVVSPLETKNGNYLLNRGWIPFNKKDLEVINNIDQNKKVELKKKYKILNVKDSLEKFKSFNEFDEQTHFHGNHIIILL